MLCWCQWDIAKLTALSIHYNNSQWSYLSNATSLGQLLSFHDLTSPTACSMFEHRQHKFLEKANSSGFCITSTSYDTPAARCISANFAASYTHTHTHTNLTALFQGLPGWAGTRKVKPIWTLLEQETVSGSGISWAICKSAPRSRQITTPAPHHSVFYWPDALPAAQPTASKH